MSKKTKTMTVREAAEWLRAQQAVFDASGQKNDRRPEQVADMLESLHAAAVTAAIAR